MYCSLVNITKNLRTTRPGSPAAVLSANAPRSSARRTSTLRTMAHTVAAMMARPSRESTSRSLMARPRSESMNGSPHARCFDHSRQTRIITCWLQGGYPVRRKAALGLLIGLVLCGMGVGCRAKAPYRGKSVAELERMLKSTDPLVQTQGAYGLSL